MNILIAPNAFKNSLDASAAAEAIGEGLQKSTLKCNLEYFPIGDGGDGTAELIIKKCNGKIINVEVHQALSKSLNTFYGLIDNENTAVIELANASGIRLLHKQELDPLKLTTYGTGELITDALNRKVDKIILCIGGSATVDGGAGILQALGARFLNNKNEILQNIPGDLIELSAIDLSGFDKRILNCETIVLCDVENKLLGENGAAKIFGPQKGASQEDVKNLEEALTKFRDVALRQTGKDMAAVEHGGASGGVAAGLSVFCNSNLVNGIDYFLSITSFDDSLKNADLIITGEGSIDEQTLNGKGPFGVAAKAKGKNIPVIGVAGKVPVTNNVQLQKYFDVLLSINDSTLITDVDIKNTKNNLIKTGKLIGELLTISTKLR
jgi:glycerate kinase